MPCRRWMMMARTKTAARSQAPRMAVRGISIRTQPAISPSPSARRTTSGMWVLAKPRAAPGSTNRIASIRITRPRVHCSPVNAICMRWVVIKGAPLFVGSSLARRVQLDFLQPVARAGVEVEIVKALQLLDAIERGRAERGLPVKGVQDDTFEQVTEGHVVVFGECLEHFEQALLHAHPGLNAFDQQLRIVRHVYQGTTVHW